MADFFDAMNAAARSVNVMGGIYEKKLEDQARLSTQTKEIQLQTDINNMLSEIRQSGDDENWNTKVNERFERIKSGMSDKNSPYYCRNNLQAQQFEAIMEQHRVGVSAKVGQMVEQRQNEKDVVNVQNAKNQLGELYYGQDYINKANELDRGLYERGILSPEQYQQRRDLNFKKGYTEVRLKTFEASVDDAIKNGESYEKLKSKLDSAMPEMKHSDINGFEIDFDKTALDDQIDKTLRQSYYAKLNDIQQGNANKLSEIYQTLLQQNSAEARLAVARQGQMTMNGMRGLQLSETDRIKYAKFFDIFTASGSGSGSGSGSNGVNYDKFEDFIKAAPEDAIQLVRNGQVVNYHDGARLLSQTLFDGWHYENFSENKNKNIQERQATWGQKYFSSASEETLEIAMYNSLMKEKPALKLVFDTQIKPLVDDIKKNPDDYDDNTVIQLSNLWVDTVLGSNANESDEELVERFNKTKNDVILSKTKFLELDKKGKLLKTFNAKSETDVAKAARLVSEGDFLYTYNGNTFGKKTELEAKGGVVDVLKNAFAATRGISESDYGKIDFFYKPDPLHDDVTSTPVITYKNEAWVVIPKEGDKGFILKNYHNPEETIEGNLKGGKEARAEAKQQAKEAEKQAHSAVVDLEHGRVEDTNTNIAGKTNIPKAMQASGKVSSEEWNTSNGNQTTRQIYLQDTENAINKAAKNVKKDKMTEEEFFNKFGIKYEDWVRSSEKTAHFNLILKS